MPAVPGKRAAKARASSPASEPEGLRMRDLVQATGLPRETIHFYLLQGLLPKPLKTGRNTAIYGEEHLDRLQRIKELQERHFLPLRAIKAVLEEGAGEGFSAEQEALLRRVRASVPPTHPRVTPGAVAVSTLVPSKVSHADLDAMRKLGLVTVRGRGAKASVSEDDAQVLECWAGICASMKSGERVPTPDLLGVYDDAMETLVARETRVVTQLYSGLPGERIAEIIEDTLPVVARLLAAIHRKKVAAVLQGPVAPQA